MVNNQIRQKTFFSSKLKNFIEELFRSHPYGYGFARYLAGKFFYKALGEKDFEAFKDFNFPKEKIFVDIGANDGISALLFHHFNPTNSIVSFEPDNFHLKSLDKIKKKIKNYKYENIGLSNEKNSIDLYIPKVYGVYIGQLASTDKEEAYSNVFKILTTKNLEKKIKMIEKKVLVNTLDSFRFDVCAIKIDVEGHELKVLEGAKSTISKQLPILMIELKNSYAEEIFDFLKKFNYELYIFENKKLKKIGLSELSLNSNEFITNAFFINPKNNFDYKFSNQT